MSHAGVAEADVGFDVRRCASAAGFADGLGGFWWCCGGGCGGGAVVVAGPVAEEGV